MFEIGDQVVYPLHGAGQIENIEEKFILGEKKSYFMIHIPHGNMEVMVPVDGCEAAGLRPIVDSSALDIVFATLKAPSTPMNDNWNRRNRENMEKLKTGRLEMVAEVIRNLARADKIKKLSTGEKKMLSNAKEILTSEISLVLSITEDKALEMIEQAI